MFGRSKKKQAAPQAGTMQVSPEALALLQAMQAQQMQAQQMQALQAQQMQAQQMQALQAQQMPAQQMPAQQMPAPQMPIQPMPAMPVMPAQAPQMGQPPMGQPVAPPSESDLAAEFAQMPAPQAPLAPAPADGFAFAAGQVAGQLPAATDDVPASTSKKGKLSREEKRELAAKKKAEKQQKAAEKKAKATEKVEEKKRAKRRKKLAKTRFSRARYLREANGNAIAGSILWVFMILAFIFGPFFLNTAILIPQTNENMRILSETENLKRSIVSSRPKIAALVEKRKQRNSQIESYKGGFMLRADAQIVLERLATQLEEAGLEISPIQVTTTPLTAKSIIGTTARFEVIGDYLAWLRVRNNFVRTQTALSIPTEIVEIDDETGQMSITAQIVLPSQP